VKVAAVQLEPALGDVAENLRRCEALADEAGRRGAEWIVLPEFFSTGMAFLDQMADASLSPDGAATQLMLALARRHRVVVGGSFICRDADGHNRNAFLLVDRQGVQGRHDKDLPTMWENAFYVGGADDGVLRCSGLGVGAAVCWELMRTQTARRLRGRVDLIVGGSAWWSVPAWPSRALMRRAEKSNAANASRVVGAMARAVGAPMIHASHSGPVESPLPWAPVLYRGHYEGATLVCDAEGRALARRASAEGAGIVLADLTPTRETPRDPVPSRYWMHRRGLVPAAVWAYQRVHGRRWYRRHAIHRPPAAVDDHASRPVRAGHTPSAAEAG
jgi:predicted amidohydrolase